MADYSELGIPSPEWARYFQDNPNDVFAKGFVPDIASRPIEYLEELQRTANRNQIAAAQAKCKQMGKKNSSLGSICCSPFFYSLLFFRQTSRP